MNKYRKLKFVVLGGCAILILYYALLLNYTHGVNPESFVSCPAYGFVPNWNNPTYIDELCSQGYRESEWTNTFTLCKWIVYVGVLLVIPFVLYDVKKNKKYWKEQLEKLNEDTN